GRAAAGLPRADQVDAVDAEDLPRHGADRHLPHQPRSAGRGGVQPVRPRPDPGGLGSGDVHRRRAPADHGADERAPRRRARGHQRPRHGRRVLGRGPEGGRAAHRPAARAGHRGGALRRRPQGRGVLPLPPPRDPARVDRRVGVPDLRDRLGHRPDPGRGLPRRARPRRLRRRRPARRAPGGAAGGGGRPLPRPRRRRDPRGLHALRQHGHPGADGAAAAAARGGRGRRGARGVRPAAAVRLRARRRPGARRAAAPLRQRAHLQRPAAGRGQRARGPPAGHEVGGRQRRRPDPPVHPLGQPGAPVGDHAGDQRDRLRRRRARRRQQL
ncbi:MAG: ATP synthase gamma chain, partial [uncultured Quadrisphaera sp.]